MDFTYSEEQEAVRQLAGQIFGERADPRIAQGDRGGGRTRGSDRP